MKLTQLIKSYRPLVLLAFLFGVATVATNLGLQSTSSYLIAQAAQHPSTILLLWTTIVAVRFFGTARAGFRYVDRYFSHDATLRWLRDLKTAIYKALEPRSLVSLKSYSTGDLMTRVGSDVDSLQNLLVGLYEPVFVAALGIFIVLAIGLLFNWRIAIALTAMLIVTGFVLAASSHHLANLSGGLLVNLRSDLSAYLVQTLHGLSDVWALNLQSQAQRDIHTLQSHIRNAKHHLAQLSGIFSGLSLSISWLGMWIILLVGVWDVNHHMLHPIFLPVVALLSLASFEIVNGLPAAFLTAGSLARAQTRVAELTAAPLEEVWGSHQLRSEGNLELIFDHVSVELGDPARTILEDVSFRLKRGERIAVIGPNGSGKSTIVNTAAGLVAPRTGSVRLDNADLCQWDPDALRQQLGVVTQFPHIFHTTLRENLLLARPSAGAQDIAQAIAMTGLDSLLRALPNGLNTVVGERGSSLSGGEIKRIALARVILKNAPLLLLDEPTEGLDPVSERTVMMTLLKWAHARPILWIAHSLLSLDLADQILVLDGGRVVAQGSSSLVRDHPLVRDIVRFSALPN
ncbi:MAG: thiol reductant ABC exporter subunit CydC [Sulfobacillus acidophilus]|uniref:Thiol reductant ABC exporter subunit CydC n=1 Tax=Sulfobacillus acidophilus TaxID=53633 RepID=A0A2T2WGX5_9FIRM|nr:MAG: thiol reductant ABC exporter subunit CydC [Sulfobacillus acidophilus]